MKLKSLIAGALLTAVSVPAMAAQMNVPMNETSVVHIEGTPAAIIVGNPMVADVTLVDGSTLVLHGRLFGNTDVTVLDAEGAELMNIDLSVTDTWRGGLTLHTGGETGARASSVSYVCNNNCVRVVHPGDDSEAASSLNDQSGDWQTLTGTGMSLGDEGN